MDATACNLARREVAHYATKLRRRQTNGIESKNLGSQ